MQQKLDEMINENSVLQEVNKTIEERVSENSLFIFSFSFWNYAMQVPFRVRTLMPYFVIIYNIYIQYFVIICFI